MCLYVVVFIELEAVFCKNVSHYLGQFVWVDVCRCVVIVVCVCFFKCMSVMFCDNLYAFFVWDVCV